MILPVPSVYHYDVRSNEEDMVTATGRQSGTTFGDSEVPRPEDAGCDVTRRVWNAMVDWRPALVNQCRDSGELVAALVGDGGAGV
jgi:hypothetical protein